MIQELLVKDLYGRFPYDLKCKICLDEYCKWNPEYNKILVDAAKVKPKLPSKIREKIYTLYGIEGTRVILLEFEDHGYGVPIEFIKPYLRPLSSMTEEERKEFTKLFCKWHDDELFDYIEEGTDFSIWKHKGISPVIFDWLNAHYFDYRGLIEKGLAIEAPDGMYKI